MKYLLDTNIIIYFMKGNYPKVASRFAKTHRVSIAIPTPAISELEYGARKSGSYEKRMELYGEFCRKFKSVSFDRKAANFYGAIRDDLEKRGLIIGEIDMFIAAIALANHYVLVTHNVREFSRVKGLKIQDWTI
ncbi:MAG: type II toxin-antitoxin system VapC family toxin [Bacilli bacterium]|nr:type II toxin-antitoxin system VapC family toxin [Bacilli bacterium]